MKKPLDGNQLPTASPGPHPCDLDEPTLLRYCRIERTRASGPGGQHRNKVETAIRITHEPTGLTAQASERRSQEANRRVALRRLRLELALRHRVTRASAATPSPRWAARCSGTSGGADTSGGAGRLAINPDHDDFPALLAEALDVLMQHEHDVPAAASTLGVTTSQLIKLLKKHPPAFALLNEARARQGAPPLR